MDEWRRGGVGAPEPERGRSVMRWLPIAGIAGVLILAWALGAFRLISVDTLRHYQDTLAGFVAAHPLAAGAAYLGLYVALVAVSFPGSGVMTITGGFLFGALAGTVLASLASIAGATLFFLAARTSLGALLAERGGRRLARLREGFQAESFGYLLVLRLVPLFPFWMVNLAAALFGMRLSTYVAATAIGVWPAAFVFAYFGAGLASAVDGGGSVPRELLLALALIGFLALVPVLVRRVRTRRGSAVR